MLKQMILKRKIKKIVGVIGVLDEAEQTKHISTIKKHLKMCRTDAEREKYIDIVYKKFRDGGLFEDVRRIHR